IGNVPLIGMLWPGSGAIRVLFGDHKMTNVALTSHVFYEGYVERTWARDANGIPQVTTRGVGTNDGFAVVTIPIKNVETDVIVVPGGVIDAANQHVGPLAFNIMDAGLLIYTTVVETGQFINEQGYYR
ncbi:MAG: hypothetical protein L0Z71_14345, partial [Anaerolineae bacterium]|nr:hypothetical protein [Anaerolineae bacterium]